MNIYLIPYTWHRHLVTAWMVGMAGLLAWWTTVLWTVGLAPMAWERGMLWPRWMGGFALFCTLAAFVGFASLFAEGALRRDPWLSRFIRALVAGAISAGLTATIYVLFLVIGILLTGQVGAWPMANDPTLLTMASRGPMWVITGLTAAGGPLVLREGSEALQWLQDRYEVHVLPPPPPRRFDVLPNLALHLGGGLAAGLVALAIWQIGRSYVFLDLYQGTALACGALGAVVGGFTWGVPDELYVGWIRVLSPERFGLRIPVDSIYGGVSERFAGHYPLGLDLHMPAGRGVAELHASFRSEGNGRYALRGLSRRRIEVRRTLERLHLSFDAREPAPFETPLQMEDRIVLGDDDTQVMLEFVRLPREER